MMQICRAISRGWKDLQEKLSTLMELKFFGNMGSGTLSGAGVCRGFKSVRLSQTKGLLLLSKILPYFAE
jgi:hypothetical protein